MKQNQTSTDGYCNVCGGSMTSRGGKGVCLNCGWEEDNLLALAYAQNPKLPKAGEVFWNQGHEFIVTSPAVHRCMGDGGSSFTHQFTYEGVCTQHACNDSIRHTGFNGGRYGWGINVIE